MLLILFVYMVCIPQPHSALVALWGCGMHTMYTNNISNTIFMGPAINFGRGFSGATRSPESHKAPQHHSSTTAPQACVVVGLCHSALQWSWNSLW